MTQDLFSDAMVVSAATSSSQRSLSDETKKPRTQISRLDLQLHVTQEAHYKETT
jgi:hypothetical protein